MSLATDADDDVRCVTLVKRRARFARTVDDGRFSADCGRRRLGGEELFGQHELAALHEHDLDFRLVRQVVLALKRLWRFCGELAADTAR